jgi:hypothetical protein
LRFVRAGAIVALDVDAKAARTSRILEERSSTCRHGTSNATRDLTLSELVRASCEPEHGAIVGERAGLRHAHVPDAHVCASRAPSIVSRSTSTRRTHPRRILQERSITYRRLGTGGKGDTSSMPGSALAHGAGFAHARMSSPTCAIRRFAASMFGSARAMWTTLAIADPFVKRGAIVCAIDRTTFAPIPSLRVLGALAIARTIHGPARRPAPAASYRAPRRVRDLFTLAQTPTTCTRLVTFAAVPSFRVLGASAIV